MKHLLSTLCILFVFNSYAQELQLNYVFFGEVYTKDCKEQEEQEVVLFMSPVLTYNIKNFTARHDYLEHVKEEYKVYLDKLVGENFPEYDQKECVPIVDNWKFFEEWDIQDSIAFKKHIADKYKDLKTFAIDFSPKLKKNAVVIEEKIEVIDPNQVLVDAYYSEAVNVFETKNYAKTTSILDKAKGLLDGETTLDIILLEAKVRYAIDKNVNEAKKLLQNFVNEAAKINDNRLREAAGLLVKIETSDYFYSTGYRKSYESEININNIEILNRDYISQDGTIYKTEQYNKNWDSKLYKEIDYTSPKGKRVINYNQDETVEKIEYFNNKDVIEFAYYKTTNQAVYFSAGKAAQSLEYYADYSKFTAYKSFESLENNIPYFNILRCNILETYPASFDLIEGEKEIKNLGVVKKLKLNLEKEDFVIYNFDEDGSPIDKTYFKKANKPKDTFEFNKSSNSWVEL